MSAQPLEKTDLSVVSSLPSLTPRLSAPLKDWLAERDRVFDIAGRVKGPVHVIFPQMMRRNISDLKNTLGDLGLQYRIYFAHKPTKSRAFIRQALKEGIGLDVASENELVSVLAAGFRGDQIECTGVKNDAFLELAARHGCLIVIDSIGELRRLAAVKDKCGIPARTNIMIRISDINFADRNQKLRHSRFGSSQRDLPEFFAFLQKRKDFQFIGYHLHNDERESDIRAGQLENMLTLMEQAYEEGFEPTLLNIGGGLRRDILQDYNEWAHFVNALEESLLEHRAPISWERFSYGMRLNDKGKVAGRGAVQGLIPSADFTKILSEIFASDRQRGRALGAIITENGFDVITEPGHALLDQCGISLFRVVETKESKEGENLVLMDGNMYNLAVPMREYLLDPIHIPAAEPKASNDEPYEGFMIGNLCREEDFLMRRKIFFRQKPVAGDLVAFVNTAAYKMDFENANPHMHIAGTKIAAYRQNGKWRSCDDNNYNPFEAGDIE